MISGKKCFENSSRALSFILCKLQTHNLGKHKKKDFFLMAFFIHILLEPVLRIWVTIQKNKKSFFFTRNNKESLLFRGFSVHAEYFVHFF